MFHSPPRLRLATLTPSLRFRVRAPTVTLEIASRRNRARARPLQCRMSSSSSSSSSSRNPRKSTVLPLLDIRTYYDDPDRFVEELRHACHNIGFFLLKATTTTTTTTNSDKKGIPTNVVRSLLHETTTFFQRPLAQKNEISYESNPSFRGYMRMGTENTNGMVDAREQIEYAAEYKNHMTHTHNRRHRQAPPLYPYYQRLQMANNPFPAYQPSLETAIMAYVPHIHSLCDIIRESLCRSLGLPTSAMDSLFGSRHRNPQHVAVASSVAGANEAEAETPHWVLKLVRYPPPSEVPKMMEESKCLDDDWNTPTEYCFGVGAHTDTNFLTMVLQDDVVGGLQVYSRGEWVDVPITTPRSNGNDNDEEGEEDEHYWICNIGEQAQIISNGYFLATPHRVIMPAHGTRERISVPFFYNPKLSASIEPILAAPTQWERPRSYDDNNHWKNKHNAMLSTVGENTFKSLARSHPKVFSKFHNDLKILPDGRIVPATVETQAK